MDCLVRNAIEDWSLIVARYKVTEISEVLRTWYVDAASEEEAEELVYGPIGGSPDKETGETIEMNVEVLG